MKKILIPVIALLVGSIAGYFVGLAYATKTFVPAMDILCLSYLSQIMELADSAYRTESTEIATWALKQSVATLTKQLEKDYESQVYTKDNLKTYLMLSYARLAKLAETQDPNQCQFYIERANQVRSERFINEPLTKERLFEFLSRLDSKHNEESEQSGAGYPPQGVGSPDP